MEGEIPRLQERPFLEQLRDLKGLDCYSLHMCRSRRSMKRDESKETYKLPHRLIEKKRRDRINECIAQLKDLLPEHLKLTTLGHLEKAVVLELTLKHLKTLTALTEQQHQKIIALQNGERTLKSPLQSDLDAFHSGFQTCTKEVLHYLSRFESWTAREQRCVQLINYLHSVCTRFLPSSPLLTPKLCGSKGACPPHSALPRGQHPHPGGGLKQESQPNCVPVIQRTQNWNSNSIPHPPSSRMELAGENDTDTDSGYGGECEGKPEGKKGQGGLIVKQEPSGDGDEVPPAAKRQRLESSSPLSVLSPEQAAAALGRPDPALLNSLMALGVGAGGGPGGSLFGQSPAAAPFCLPFYLISPSAAAACMQPFLEKISLEKSLYPAGVAGSPLPTIYPGISVQAAAGFPSLSVAVAAAATLANPAEKGSSVSAASRFPAEVASLSQPPPCLSPRKAAGLNADMGGLSPKLPLQWEKQV